VSRGGDLSRRLVAGGTSGREDADEVVIAVPSLAGDLDEVIRGELPQPLPRLIRLCVEQRRRGGQAELLSRMRGAEAKRSCPVGVERGIRRLERGGDRDLPVLHAEPLEHVHPVRQLGDHRRDRQHRLGGQTCRGYPNRQRQMAAQPTQAGNIDGRPGQPPCARHRPDQRR